MITIRIRSAAIIPVVCGFLTGAVFAQNYENLSPADYEAQSKVLREAQTKDIKRRVEEFEKQAANPNSEMNRAIAQAARLMAPLTSDTTVLMDSAVGASDPKPPILYVAPLYGAAADVSKGTMALESMLRFELRPRRPGPLALNIVPQVLTQYPYVRTAQENAHENRPPQDYLRDARAISADIFVYGRADVVKGNALFQLAFTDLHSSRTGAFTRSVPLDQVGVLVGTAAREVAKFAGLKDDAIMTLGAGGGIEALPTRKAVEIERELEGHDLATSDARGMLAAAGGGPWIAWRLMDTVGVDGAVEFSDEVIRRWPDDPRLLMAKGFVLGRLREPVLSIIFMSEFMRRQPDSLIGTAALCGRMDVAQDQRPGNITVILGQRGTLRQLDAMLQRYPFNWALRWNRGLVASRVAKRAGTLLVLDAGRKYPNATTVTEEMTRALVEPYKNLPETALADLREALKQRPDIPQLIVDLISCHRDLTDGQGDDAPENAIKWQYPLLAQINLLDPRNVEADMMVADQQAYSKESQQVRILRECAERNGRDPKVMLRVAKSLNLALYHKRNPENRDLSGETDQQQAERSKAMLGTPEAQLFAEALKPALEADLFIPPQLMTTAWDLAIADSGTYGWLWEMAYKYKNGHWKAAQETNRAGKWAESLDHARRVVHTMGDKEYETMQYCVVKALWKLKRLNESMWESQDGFARLPNRHTFHYLFAVVALELGDRLEEAYEHAKIAAKLDPKNTGIHETIAKLEDKLGKPRSGL